MKTLNLAGYHDSFEIRLNELSDKPCFKPGTLYLVELPLTSKTSILNYTKLNETELARKLQSNGLEAIISRNVAQLINFKPSCIFPCAPYKRDEDDPNQYGSLRDNLIAHLVETVVYNTSYQDINITFFGRIKHARYMNNEIRFKNKILYDFTPEQAVYCPELRKK